MIKNRLIIGTITILCVSAIGLYGYFYVIDNSNKARSIYDCPNCNIVLIVIDTLRADHLPTYGYKQDTAPFITKLANKSTVFKRAFSASSWTAPAMASIFTSLMPSRHKVVTGFAATRRLQKLGSNISLNKIPAELITLGEFMNEAGYKTIGIADNLNIGTEMGFDRGFHHFHKFYYKGANNLSLYAQKYLDQVKSDEPYFLYLHFMDPHMPYRKHEPYYQNCISSTPRSRADRVICSYNSEINYVDRTISDLANKYSWLENSIVIITSDHGEEFWDHGRTGHGKTLYTEMIHVPFVMYHPRYEATQIQTNVHTMDIMPTLAGLLDMEERAEWQGKNLFIRLQAKKFGDSRKIFSERLRHPEGRKNWWRRSIVKKDWHYIRTETESRIKNEELYNIATDYNEKNNLIKSEASIAESLAFNISQEPLPSFNEGEDSVEIKLDRELYEDLRSLGYLN